MTDVKPLKDVENILHYRLRHRYGDYTDYDDGIQEALIRVWKDYEDGTRTFKHIINRAEIWARSYWQTGRATGTPPISRDGIKATGNPTGTINRRAHDKRNASWDELTEIGAAPTRVSHFENETVTRLDLANALKQLPQELATTLYFVYYEGRSRQEAGAHLGPARGAKQRGTKYAVEGIRQMQAMLRGTT